MERHHLQTAYQARFAGQSNYRRTVWTVLARYFQQWVPPQGAVLDLGAGSCEFINNINARAKYAVDLNPDLPSKSNKDIILLQQDCSDPWPLENHSLHAVFTSNFFEHLPNKTTLLNTLSEAYRCMKPGGHLIAIGPNIKYLCGDYWDFYDHYIPLTHLSLAEALRLSGFQIHICRDRFLPYSMSTGRQYPIWTLRAYLMLPFAWRIFGKQFLIVARKATGED